MFDEIIKYNVNIGRKQKTDSKQTNYEIGDLIDIYNQHEMKIRYWCNSINHLDKYRHSYYF